MSRKLTKLFPEEGNHLVVMRNGSLVNGYQVFKKDALCFLQGRRTLILGYTIGLRKAPKNPVDRSPRESENPKRYRIMTFVFFFFSETGFRSCDSGSVCNVLNNYVGKLPLSNDRGRGTSSRLSTPLQQTIGLCCFPALKVNW
jgi:hypothetical protein